MKYYLPLLSILFLVVYSCKKVEVPQSKEEMLRGKWKIEYDFKGKGIGKEFVKYPILDTSKKIVDTIYTPLADGVGNDYVKDDKGVTVLNDRGRATYNVHVMPACKLDDYLEFREGINGGLNTGKEKCPNGEVSEIPIKWGFLDNYTRMYIYDAGDMFMGNDDVTAHVKEFDGSRLVLRYGVVDNLTEINRKDTSFYTVTLLKM